ncbi:MAG: MarR family transcriptional regulator [Clostridium sp.]|nr:MarR family transcriptional regulator [Clostridium sp.]MCI7444342.1 MarR family transcriptional regulator [Clostridium sp.]
MEDEFCIGKAIHMVGNQMKRLADNAAAEYGLTSIQSRMIRFLYLESKKRDVYQKDIEEEFNIRRSSVSSVLQLLEKKGYIERVSVEKDGRLKKIVLTGTGKLIQEKVHSLIQEGEKRLKDELTEEELNLFIDILSRLSKKLG